jgi:hypothetical protein
LQLRDTSAVVNAAFQDTGLASTLSPGADPLTEFKRVAANARQSGHDGWILLIDNVDAFDGDPRTRAESYAELMRWMGGLRDEQYLGLFCVLAVTPEFERAVQDPAELGSIRTALRATGDPRDLQLLDAAEGGIGALEHEVVVHELLVLEW